MCRLTRRLQLPCSLVLVRCWQWAPWPRFHCPTSRRRNCRRKLAAKSIDYYHVLAWVLPIGAVTLVLFQIYVPVQSGLLNVNLADPLSDAGGVLFILMSVRLGHLPRWRVAYVNLAAAAATLVLGGSLLIGADRFGWTTWAVTNRFLGWFVLLAYGATGALIVRAGQKEGFRTILLTFAGATAAVAGIEVSLVMLTGLGFQAPVVLGNAQGFSLNHNFFAFQLLMAMSAAIAAVRGASLRIVVLALVLAGFWFAGSRSGWIAALFVLSTSLYLGVLNVRELLTATTCAAGAALIAVILPDLVQAPINLVPAFLPSEASTQERLISILGGLKLFLEYPAFGAGLGAFRNQMIFVSSSQPLLIHSTALWLLAELGMIGLLAFAVPAIYVFITESRLAAKSRHLRSSYCA